MFSHAASRVEVRRNSNRPQSIHRVAPCRCRFSSPRNKGFGAKISCQTAALETPCYHRCRVLRMTRWTQRPSRGNWRGRIEISVSGLACTDPAGRSSDRVEAKASWRVGSVSKGRAGRRRPQGRCVRPRGVTLEGKLGRQSPSGGMIRFKEGVRGVARHMQGLLPHAPDAFSLCI